jgi:cytidylate kinase
MTGTAQEMTRPHKSSIAACVAAVTLTSHCLATTGGFYRAVAYQRYGDTHIDTQTDGRDL